MELFGATNAERLQELLSQYSEKTAADPGKPLAENELKTDHVIESLRIIENYGQIDGDHHRAWCLDQVARHLLAHLGPNYSYETWVEDMKAGQFGPDTYEYDAGVAP
jgi:hypothetical protein